MSSNTRTRSSELLHVEESQFKVAEKAVFSLLQEKSRSNGTFKVGPSSLLQKVKEFLPQMEKANKEIESSINNDPNRKKEYDIEAIEENNGPVIQMDLAFYKDLEPEFDLAYSTDISDQHTSPNTGTINESNIKIPGRDTKKSLVQVLDNEQESSGQY